MEQSELQERLNTLADKYFMLVEELANANMSDFKRLTKAAQRYILMMNQVEPVETGLVDLEGKELKSE